MADWFESQLWHDYDAYCDACFEVDAEPRSFEEWRIARIRAAEALAEADLAY